MSHHRIYLIKAFASMYIIQSYKIQTFSFSAQCIFKPRIKNGLHYLRREENTPKVKYENWE